MMRWLWIAGGVVLTVLVLSFVLGVVSWRRPILGSVEGKLRSCEGHENCVCSLENDDLPPLTFTGEPSQAWERLKKVVTGLPRSRIVTEKDGYLHAEVSSAVFRFVDDVEFLMDVSKSQIHFRSASRVGKADLGVNADRMQTVRKAFESAP